MPKETFIWSDVARDANGNIVQTWATLDLIVSWGHTEPVLINDVPITGEDLDRLIKVLKKARKQTQTKPEDLEARISAQLIETSKKLVRAQIKEAAAKAKVVEAHHLDEAKRTEGVPTSRGSVRTNGQRSTQVIAGSWTELGDWSGHWSYSDLDGSYTSITVGRAKDGSGWNSAAPTTLRLDGVEQTLKVSLAPGQVRTLVLPKSWTDALKGNATIHADGHGKNEYLTFTTDSGALSN